MKAAILLPLEEVPGECWRYRSFRRLVRVIARVVLPEPGMPEMERR